MGALQYLVVSVQTKCCLEGILLTYELVLDDLGNSTTSLCLNLALEH